MTPQLTRAPQEEAEVYITTYDEGGSSGTVPVWFVYEKGKVYTTTGRASVKARRIGKNGRVRLAFGRRDGPTLEGVASFCTEEATARKVVKLLSQKYDGYYGPEEEFVEQLLKGDSVLLEIIPASV